MNNELPHPDRGRCGRSGLAGVADPQRFPHPRGRRYAGGGKENLGLFPLDCAYARYQASDRYTFAFFHCAVVGVRVSF